MKNIRIIFVQGSPLFIPNSLIVTIVICTIEDIAVDFTLEHPSTYLRRGARRWLFYLVGCQWAMLEAVKKSQTIFASFC